MDLIPWEVALQRLKAGNGRYSSDNTRVKPNDAKRRAALIAGQHPFAIILTCSDSRVAPEFVFDSGLGELFVIRVAGNIPNPSSIASIEYAVAQLGARLILVMGHETCGAVAAAMEGGDAGKYLNHLLSFIQPAVEEVSNNALGADVDDIARLNSQYSAANLTEESVILRNAVSSGDVHIVTAFYNLGSGIVDFDDIDELYLP